MSVQSVQSGSLKVFIDLVALLVGNDEGDTEGAQGGNSVANHFWGRGATVTGSTSSVALQGEVEHGLVAKGRVDVNGKTFNTGDAARIRDGGSLSFTNGDNAEILIFDMRPEEVPTMP